MPVRIQTKDFDAGAEVAALRRDNPKVGAVASFIGVCRDAKVGGAGTKMTLEDYTGMTEKAHDKTVSDAKRRWEAIELLVAHLVGELNATDPIETVSVARAHPGE